MLADLNAVSCFAKVVELSSFRAAAAALGVPKSTVSRKVGELEDTLGTRLLERTTRRLRLTEAGSAYYQRIGPALEALRDAESVASEQSIEPSGRLRITMSIEGGQKLLGSIMNEYMTRYPKVELVVELTDRRVDLVEEGFDLAIRAGALPDSSLIARRVGTPGTLLVYASPSYLKRRGTPKHPRDLVEHDCLVMTGQSTPLVWTFHQKGAPLRIKVRPRASVNSFTLLRELVAAGHGIARLPNYLAVEGTSPHAIRSILDDFTPPPMPWHVVYPSASNLSPKVRALAELFEERFGHAPKVRGAGPKRTG